MLEKSFHKSSIKFYDCGKIKIGQKENNWTFRIIWKNDSSKDLKHSINDAEIGKLSKNNNCFSKGNIYLKKNIKNIFEYYDVAAGKFYNNESLYIFNIESNDKLTELLSPCAILKSKDLLPETNISNDKKILELFKSNVSNLMKELSNETHDIFLSTSNKSKKLSKRNLNNQISKPIVKTINGIIDAHFSNIILYEVIFFVVALALIIFGSIIIANRNRLVRYIKKIGNPRSDTNIYKFWLNNKDTNFKEYFKIIHDIKYIPQKLHVRYTETKIIGGENVEVIDELLFNDSLVESQTKVENKICANYLSSTSFDRVYILSDGPKEGMGRNYWKMIYDEQITSVVIIVNESTDVTEKYDPYWLINYEKYDKLEVKKINKLEEINISYTKVLHFELLMDNLYKHDITIFLVHDWIDNTIPDKPTFFFELYHNVSTITNNGGVLIHGNGIAGSRIFIYTYFVCIVESMKNNEKLCDPFKVIKLIREQRSGGLLSIREFAFLTNLIIRYFIMKNLLNVDQSVQSYFKKYEAYICNFQNREFFMDPTIKQFLCFINTLDVLKLCNLVEIFNKIGYLNNEEKKKKCKIWNEIKEREDKDENKKNRYMDIPCIDEHAIIYDNKNSLPLRFMHASKFNYTLKDNETRKLILAQNPLPNSFGDFFHMLYNEKVDIIVILINYEDYRNGNWDGYFPKVNEEIVGGEYVMKSLKVNVVEKDYICSTNFTLSSKEKDKFPCRDINVIYFKNWPDNATLPDPAEICNLYETINKYNNCETTLIHCSNGIGKSGILSLVIHMIDTAQLDKPFDPINCLLTLRQHRYGAVQSPNHFLYCLKVTCQYFKTLINKFKPNMHQKILNMIEETHNVQYLQCQLNAENLFEEIIKSEDKIEMFYQNTNLVNEVNDETQEE